MSRKDLKLLLKNIAIKPDKFFSFKLYTKDGFVEIDGKKIGAVGMFVEANVYKNGSVG